MTNDTRVEFCPHCCNRAPQTLLLEQIYEDIGWSVSDGEEYPYDGTFYVARCETCKAILLYNDIEGGGFKHAELIFPDIRIDKSVPENIAKIYDEAIRIKNVAPNAFAVQIRRGLEAICKDRGTTKRTLAEQIKELGEKGELPQTLSEASDILRLIGNIGAHASDEHVHPLQVMAIDNFFKAIVEFIYISPSKIMAFKQSLKSYRDMNS